MPELVDNLANLTALRDRDALDIALVSAINDLLQPQTTGICRVVATKPPVRLRILYGRIRAHPAPE